jgi:hypothetical protein
VLIADPYGSPGSNVAVRVLNLSLVTPFIDVYLTPPGADIAAANAVLSGGSYGVVTTFVNTTAGDLELRITGTGSKDVIYDAPVTLAPGTGQTVVAYGKGSSKLVNGRCSLPTSGAIVNSQLAQFKVANGTAVPAPVNVLVDRRCHVEPRVCHRRALPDAGVGRAADHGRIICRPGCDTFVDCSNFRARDRHVDPVVRRPDRLPPRARRFESNLGAPGAQLRIVNVSPDFAAVDVYANFGKLVSGLPRIRRLRTHSSMQRQSAPLTRSTSTMWGRPVPC